MLKSLQRCKAGGYGLAIMLLFLGFATVRAQISFERVYTPQGSSMRGIGVTLGCSFGGTGFFSVGSRANGSNSDVYMVRTKGDGTVLWEKTYDIGGVGRQDYANSVVELSRGVGYVITGVTQRDGWPFDIFVLHIDCDGNVVWLKTFGDSLVNDWASDIKAAPALSGDGTEDVVISGWRNTSSTNHDALLMRLTSAGVPIWERIYDVGGDETFNALTVTTKVGAGDIVAVGNRTAPGQASQAFMARVGPNGLIGAAPQGLADFGAAGSSESFRSVIELQQPGPESGKLVAIGETNVAATWDIYVVKTQSAPCSQNPVQMKIGKGVVGPGPVTDLGYDIKELKGNMPNYSGMGAGYLILTGYSNDRMLIPPPPRIQYRHDNMILLGLNPTNLVPIGGTGRLFGGNSGTGGSYGISLVDVDDMTGLKRGIIICGKSTDYLSSPTAATEYYVVKTNDAGHTDCDSIWTPPFNSLQYAVNCPPPTITELFLGVDDSYQVWGPDNDVDVCPRLIFPKLTPEIGKDDEAPVIGSSITSAPNPIERGEVSTLSYTAATEGEIVLTVADEVGKIVNRSSLDAMRGRNAIVFDTHDLPAGVYMITIANGDDVQRTRVVIVSRR